MGANSTGTPTTLGIPTLNTNQDILKGDSINEIVASVDSKIAARMFAPASPANTQVAKWSSGSSSWIADYVSPAELKQAAATSGQALYWNGANWAPLALAHLPSTNITDPIGTTNTTYTMQGINKTLTPTGTGRLRITIDGQYASVSGGSGKISMTTGTGTPPVNAAATTGTTSGNELQPDCAAGANHPFSLTREVVVTVNVALWVDLALARVSATDFAVGRMTIVIDEIL